MQKKYIVRLSEEEKASREKLISSGSGPARKLNHARILMKANADGPNWSDKKSEKPSTQQKRVLVKIIGE